MIEKVKGKEHLVRKRDGRLEKYMPTKLKRALDFCTNNNKIMTDDLFESLDLKIYNKIRIEKLWEAVIETSANKISAMFPMWDEVAKRAYILKIYKETYNLKSENDVCHYSEILKKGMSVNIYNREIINTFSEEEINQLNDYLVMKRDFNFSFIGLVTMMTKYSFNYSITKKLELPQHIYMRLAIEAFWCEKENRMEKIKKRYDDLSLFYYTEATPKMTNSLTYNNQMASCVLTKTDDNIESINETDANLGMFSKHSGGLSVDVSKLRCSGSLIGKMGGKSSGPVKFIKKFQETVSAFDQKGTRPGACVVNFPFWHYDVKDIMMLKDAGGSEEKRARKLKYTIKWYKILSKRIKKNENITLFDPKEVPELIDSYGKDFEKWYLYYESRNNIKKQVIPARELAYLFAKIRSETGNLYVVFPDNINSQRLGEKIVTASNLCTEIFIPSDYSKDYNFKIIKNFGDNSYTTVKTNHTGEIGLCNLSSINIIKWITLNENEKNELIYNLLLASDNLIENQFYPVPDGELSNKLRRPIGIGVSNYANYLAYNKASWDSIKAKQLTHEIFEELSYFILKNSVKLAKERGKYSEFYKSNWNKGLLPMDLYKMKNNNEFNFPLKYDWDLLRKEIKKYGLRFSYHMAIAPTATSSLTINTTEGIDPIKKIFQMKEGTYNLPILAPNLKENRMYYNLAFDISNKDINNLASIRQKFLDQGQSVTHFYKITNSTYEIIKDIFHAEEVGMKSCYYLQPMKAGDIEICESCSS